MKKFWQLVSKRYLVFGILLFALVIGISLMESPDKVTVNFGDDAVTVAASRHSMTISYEDIDHTELVTMPDPGEAIDGFYDMTVRSGSWSNDTWGEYFICADEDADECIVIHLTDGRIMVFNRKDNEETNTIYETLLTYLPET